MSDRVPAPVAWATSSEPVGYDGALAIMEARAAAIADGRAGELVWLLEHPPLYTAGTSTKPEDLISSRFPVHPTGRGGQLTYHGPGQRVVYLMLDVKARHGSNVRAFVQGLEAWIIDALGSLGVTGRIVPGRVGVWVDERPGAEAKIAALGLRIRRGVSLHGVSLNVAPDLEHYGGIVPCGISDRGVTSLERLGSKASAKDVDKSLRAGVRAAFRTGF